MTQRADPLMAWLGIVFALLVGYAIAVDLRGGVATAFEVVSWVIWGIFALEFATKLWLAPRRIRYLRRHWWQPIMLVLPFLRVISFLRLARAGRALPASRVLSSSYRAVGTAKYLLRSRLAYLGGLGVVAAIAVAELAYVFEREAPSAIFSGFGDALVWSASTVIALQADPVPQSPGGRLAMLFGFTVGLVLIASLAAAIGSYLVEDRRERDVSGQTAGNAGQRSD